MNDRRSLAVLPGSSGCGVRGRAGKADIWSTFGGARVVESLVPLFGSPQSLWLTLLFFAGQGPAMTRISISFACLSRTTIGLLIAGFAAPLAVAKSPAVLAEGRMLFEKNWSAGNPSIGSDGLGPLFNGRSCVACHRQGGVGGAGEAEFNAKTIGIERMQITGGAVDRTVVANAISAFHPGFVDPSGNVVNTFALSHHGGTARFDAGRTALMERVDAEFSSNGGPVSSEEVRRANATPIVHTANLGQYKVLIRARMFQRNTTPLFGSGLIDAVTVKQLEAVVREQAKNPEISGRLATLPDGRVGRFGWRGNVATLLEFCDQACAAEVGLETKRKKQPSDPTHPDYRNPAIDISDSAIKAMGLFVASLPAPQRQIPEDSEQRAKVLRGEQLFGSAGCAVCHRPSLGPAQGLYSDLLLHDMGYESIDLNPADPYISRITPVVNVDRRVQRTGTQTRSFDDTVSTTYYGRTTSMTGSTSQMSSDPVSPGQTNGRFGQRSRGRRSAGYDFIAPLRPATTIRFVTLDRDSRQFEFSSEEQRSYRQRVNRNQKTESGRDFFNVEETTTFTDVVTETTDLYLRIHIESTEYAQEWRTPPLWGVRDSAPYWHDGRAGTLLEAISMHDGEAAGTRDRFLQLPLADRHAIVAFLDTLVAPANAPQQDLAQGPDPVRELAVR